MASESHRPPLSSQRRPTAVTLPSGRTAAITHVRCERSIDWTGYANVAAAARQRAASSVGRMAVTTRDRVTLLQQLMTERRWTRNDTLKRLDARAPSVGADDFALSLR